ncbi:hypothetical protein [Streptomyces sp. 8N616]|uniref:hypothetical protein n=1 Tax=Streptomyces sp. 8N616 TaxID=3457414 RepID=UPI003FD0029A
MSTAWDGEAFESSLRTAEELLSGVRRARVALWSLRGAEGALGLLPLAASTTGYAARPGAVEDSGSVMVPALLAGLAAVAAAVVVEVVVARRLRRRIDRDRSRLAGEISMLREVLVHVSVREGWSKSRTRGARARIARFSIEGKGSW